MEFFHGSCFPWSVDVSCLVGCFLPVPHFLVEISLTRRCLIFRKLSTGIKLKFTQFVFASLHTDWNFYCQYQKWGSWPRADKKPGQEKVSRSCRFCVVRSHHPLSLWPSSNLHPQVCQCSWLLVVRNPLLKWSVRTWHRVLILQI